MTLNVGFSDVDWHLYNITVTPLLDEKIYLQCDLYVVADLFAFLDRERAIFVYISLALLMILRENKTSVNRLTAFPVY